MRRAQHDKVVAPSLAACSNCGEPTISHRVCPSCGYYKGAKIETGAKKAGELSLGAQAPPSAPHGLAAPCLFPSLG